MPRNFSLALKTYLSESSIALCNCVRLERFDADGISAEVLGFTSLDADLTVGGIVYEAMTSADASELSAKVGTGVDNLDIVALLTSARISETDLLAGIWDGAKASLFFFPFDRTDLGVVGPLITGTIGEITEDGGQFTAEIRGLTQRLSQQFVELASPLCRVHQLFDIRCMPNGSNEGTDDGTITPASCRNTRTVSQVDSAQVIRFSSEPGASGLYSYGKVTFQSGANAGIAREIKTHVITSPSIAILTLQEAFPFSVQIGDTAILEWGCNRTFSQCQTRFKNHVNVQSEPFLPGNALLTRKAKA